MTPTEVERPVGVFRGWRLAPLCSLSAVPEVLRHEPLDPAVRRFPLSKYGNARLRTAFWMAAQSALRMRENSLRRKFDRYVHRNPLEADLRRKAYSAVAPSWRELFTG